ncbi:MAG: GNVR domain-containing protein [Bacteroidota bacterium]
MSKETMQSAESEENEKVIARLWEYAGTLFRWRRVILGVTGLVAVVAIVISLFMATWYAASARVLSPESSGTNPLSAALASNLASAASAFLGGGNGDYLRYKTILSSRTMYERVVDEFDLVTVYETQESLSPRESAIRMLAENTAYPIDEEDEFLSIVVLDTDPQRAADMANFIVQELNARNSELASQDAGNYRRFVESRYDETLVKLDSLKDQLQLFQETNQVFDLESQATAFLEQVADLRGESYVLEIEYETLKQQFGATNPRVRVARQAMETARRKGDEVLAGGGEVLPIARGDFPEVMRTYVELEQELRIQKSILEIIAPMYEQARFQEERKFEAVQVVDKAVAPTDKAKPKRKLIVIGATLSGLLLSILFVLVLDWWQRKGGYVLQRISDEAKKGA